MTKESTERALKTLVETFAATFVIVFAGGLTGGLVDVGALQSLAVAALSAAVAAVASKVVNLGKDALPEEPEDGEHGGD